MIGLGTAAIVGSAIAGLATVGSAVGSYFSNKQSNKTNKDYANQNINIQKEQLAYQKYLNNNQIQIQAADAQKAGINPIAMQGGSLSSGNYSNVNANQSAVDYGSFGSSVASLTGDIYSSITQKSVSDAQNKTTLSVAKSQQESNERIESIKAQAQVESAMIMAEAQNYTADMRSADQKAYLDYRAKNDKVVNSLQEKLNESQIELNKALQRKNFSDASYTNLMSILKQQQWDYEKNLRSQLNDRQQRYLDLAYAQLELAAKDKKWEHAMSIVNSINDFLKTGVMAVGAFSGFNLSSPSSVFGSDTSWFQGH